MKKERSIEQKRALKDLPFWNIKKGSVILRDYDKDIFKLSATENFHNSMWDEVFSKSEEDLLRLLWDNKDWFEKPEIGDIVIGIENNKITLHFNPLSLYDVKKLSKEIKELIEENFKLKVRYPINQNN